MSVEYLVSAELREWVMCCGKTKKRRLKSFKFKLSVVSLRWTHADFPFNWLFFPSCSYATAIRCTQLITRNWCNAFLWVKNPFSFIYIRPNHRNEFLSVLFTILERKLNNQTCEQVFDDRSLGGNSFLDQGQVYLCSTFQTTQLGHNVSQAANNKMTKNKTNYLMSRFSST